MRPQYLQIAGLSVSGSVESTLPIARMMFRSFAAFLKASRADLGFSVDWLPPMEAEVVPAMLGEMGKVLEQLA